MMLQDCKKWLCYDIIQDTVVKDDHALIKIHNTSVGNYIPNLSF